jgi:hypothetical protein
VALNTILPPRSCSFFPGLDQIAAERFFAADVGKWRAEFWVFGLVLRSLVELEEFSAARGASTGRNCSYANCA